MDNPVARQWADIVLHAGSGGLVCFHEGDAVVIEEQSLLNELVDSGRLKVLSNKPKHSEVSQNASLWKRVLRIFISEDLRVTYRYFKHLVSLNFRLWRGASKIKLSNFTVVSINAEGLAVAYIISRFRAAKFWYQIYEIWPFQRQDTPPLQVSLMNFYECFLANRAEKAIAWDSAVKVFSQGRFHRPEIFICNTCPKLPVMPRASEVKIPIRLYYHGMLSLDRGIGKLVKAIDKVGGFEFHIRGFGPDKDKIIELLKNTSNPNRFQLLEPVPMVQLPETGIGYQIGVILFPDGLLNTKYGIGFKLFEYLASGLAILGPENRVYREFYRQYPVGWMYGKNGESELIDILNEIRSDLAEIPRKMSEAKVLAEKKFNIDVQRRKMLRAAGYEMKKALR
jgi:glycosyltransferase involved in cell wall biosynthesis